MKTRSKYTFLKWGVMLASLPLVVACGGDDGPNNPLPGVDGGGNVNPDGSVVDPDWEWFDEEYRCETAPTITWADVNDWHYQLQFADYKALAASKYDLMVLDSEPPSETFGGRPPTPNKNITERLKCSGDGEKLLVSYLAIGQAESYRYFYQDDWGPGNPSWIYEEDEYWPGDFYVRYWDPEWKAILMGSPNSRVDRIVAAGFDGIYLDTIDAYTFFYNSEDPASSENPNALEDMQTLIKEVSDYARLISGNPNFGVFVQNAEELIDPNWYIGPEWVEPLTGIGKEEPFYWATDDKVGEDQRYWNDYYLSQWVDAGKLVMNVDYVTKPEFIEEVYTTGRAKGYIPLAISTKELDALEINTGYEPD